MVERRAAELKIGHVAPGARVRRSEPFRDLLETLGLEPRQVCYVGDDLADLPVLRVVAWRPVRRTRRRGSGIRSSCGLRAGRPGGG